MRVRSKRSYGSASRTEQSAWLSRRARRPQRRRAARLDALEKELDSDALGVISKRGIKARDIAERIVKEGTPDARIEALERELRERDDRDAKRQKELEDQLTARQQREQYDAARKQLHATFSEMKEKLPILSRLCTTESRIEREYMAAWQTIQSDPEASKQRWTDAEIFEAMEQAKVADRDAFLEGSDADVLEKVLTNKRASVTTDGKASSGSVRQGIENASSSGAKTLTNGQSAARVTADEEFDIRPGETLAQADKRQNRELTERLRRERRG